MMMITEFITKEIERGESKKKRKEKGKKRKETKKEREEVPRLRLRVIPSHFPCPDGCSASPYNGAQETTFDW